MNRPESFNVPNSGAYAVSYSVGIVEGLTVTNIYYVLTFVICGSQTNWQLAICKTYKCPSGDPAVVCSPVAHPNAIFDYRLAGPNNLRRSIQEEERCIYLLYPHAFSICLVL
jgi:hypothetical protein